MGPNSLVSDVGKGPRMRKPHLSMCRPPQVIAQGRKIVALCCSRVCTMPPAQTMNRFVCES